MTSTDRAALEQEIAARTRYMEAVRVHGPERFLSRRQSGCAVTTWTGVEERPVIYRRSALATVCGITQICAARISELTARLEAAAFDEALAGATPEEREISARAQHEAFGPGRRWRRSE